MSKKLFLFIAILSITFIAACQPNPTPLDSTYQPRDNRQVLNKSETNAEMTNTSMNKDMSNANSTMNSNAATGAPVNANSMNRPPMNAEPHANSNK